MCVSLNGFGWHLALLPGEYCCLHVMKPQRWQYLVGSFSYWLDDTKIATWINVCGLWVFFSLLYAHATLESEPGACFTGVKFSPGEAEDLRKRWQCAVGPRYEVIVRFCMIRTQWISASLFKKQFTFCCLKVDVCPMILYTSVQVCQVERFAETSGLGVSLEARAGHHYLCSVLPEGPVGQSGKIFAGDQILEVIRWYYSLKKTQNYVN